MGFRSFPRRPGNSQGYENKCLGYVHISTIEETWKNRISILRFFMLIFEMIIYIICKSNSCGFKMLRFLLIGPSGYSAMNKKSDREIEQRLRRNFWFSRVHPSAQKIRSFTLFSFHQSDVFTWKYDVFRNSWLLVPKL